MPKINCNGISICYEKYGNSNRPCILLVSGLSSQLIQWPPDLINGLVNKGFQVLVFDNRDIGLSSYYDHLTTPNILEALHSKQKGKQIIPPYSLKDMSQDIKVLMDGLEIAKAHIVGMSMGGMISQIFASQFHGRALSLTCIASTSSDPKLPPAKPEVLNYYLNLSPKVADFDSYLKAMLYIHHLYNHPNDINEKYAIDIYTRAYKRAYHPSGNTRQLLAIMFAEARTHLLQKLTIPSLVIHGDYDPVFPLAHGEELAKVIPNSHLEVISKMGHGLSRRILPKIVDLISQHAITQN